MNTKLPQASARRTVRLAVKMALAGSVMIGTLASAGLRDRGPSNAVVYFPDWYRDANGLALGQCINGDQSPAGGDMCLLAGADPNGFPGNFGEEGFYATADITIPVTGGVFHWIGHLEMAYATASGAPPAIRDPLHPQEVVFSRERMRFDVPAGCAGHYTIRTPFKVHEFDLEEGTKALNYTDDLTPIPGEFNTTLQGHTGPFLTWDDYENNPALTITPPAGPARHYIGDPNVPHVFVGSTVPAGPGHEDKGYNNYLEIIPPSTCDLGSGGGTPLFEDNAAISGLIWGQPIADPVQLEKAVYTRDGSSSGVDVWVSGPKNQNVVVTASNSSSQHLPSATLKEEIKDGERTGYYHAHLEFEPSETVPGQVTVSNLSSNPVAHSSRSVVDAVVVTKSEYDPSTGKLCIAAHSGDQAPVDPLDPGASEPVLEAEGYGTLGPATSGCPRVDSNDVVLETNLGSSGPDFRLPPDGILIKSSKGGSETTKPVVPAKGISYSDADVHQQAVDDSFDVDGAGVTQLDLTSNDNSLPGNHRIVIVSQPEMGKVSAPSSGGNVDYEAEAGMPAGEQAFFYAIQDTTSAGQPVSNVAKVTLNVTQSLPPPVGVADAMGVLRTSAGVNLPVLANDSTGLTSTAIDPASIQIVAGPGRGTATPQPDGSIRYVPVGQGGTANNTLDSFTYTVANTAGSRSDPITVNVVLKSAQEAVSFTRVRFKGGWDLRFTSTYAGVAGSVTLAPVATCKLYQNSTAYANGSGTPIGTIGSAAPGAGTNAYRINASGPVPPGGNAWVVGCTTSSGGRGSRTGTL